MFASQTFPDGSMATPVGAKIAAGVSIVLWCLIVAMGRWIAWKCRVPHGRAARMARNGRALRHLPEVEDAYIDGLIAGDPSLLLKQLVALLAAGGYTAVVTLGILFAVNKLVDVRALMRRWRISRLDFFPPPSHWSKGQRPLRIPGMLCSLFSPMS